LKSVMIKMLSQAGTGYFYVARKNPMTTPHKMQLRKYDPVVKQHVLFEETKMRVHRGGRKRGGFPRNRELYK